jgi:hypothetical protein
VLELFLFKFERSDSEEEERETGAGARKEEPDLLRYTTLIPNVFVAVLRNRNRKFFAVA